MRREPAMAPGSMRQIRDVTKGSWLKQSEPVALRDAHRWILLPAGQSDRRSGQKGNVSLHKCDNLVKAAEKVSNPQQGNAPWMVTASLAGR